MAVIIRLQNLPWSANAMDIRQFFHGLNIPDGGVHIVGGEKGDAFIAFSTDEDARQAMNRSGDCLNNVAVKLLLSSKSEMQTVIASARGVPLSAVPGMAGFANTAPPSAEAFGPGFREGPPIKNDMPQAFYGGGGGLMGEYPNWDANMMPPSMDMMGNGFQGGPGPMGPMPPMGMPEGMDDPRRRNIDYLNDGTDCCCYVTNMPPSINYRDVRRLFSGLEIPRDGLKLINDETGERVGEAFVRFANPDVAERAATHVGWEMDGQPVFVERCPFDVFQKAVDSFIPARRQGAPGNSDDYPPSKRRREPSPGASKHNTTCAVIKNLPYDVQKPDLFHFFTGMRFAKGDASVHIENRPDGRPSGVGLIEFATDRDIKKATQLFGDPMRGRQVEIHPIPLEEFQRRVETSGTMAPSRPRRPRPDRREDNEGRGGDKRRMDDGNGPNRGGSMERPRKRSSRDNSPKKDQVYYCVSLFGLPYSCTYEMVEEFFSGLRIAHRGIHLVKLANGRSGPTGFVEFTTAADCEKAMERHKAYMGSRYIEVKQVTKRQMEDDIDRLKKIELRKSGMLPSRGPPGGENIETGSVVRIANLHHDATLEDIGRFFQGFSPIMSSVKIRYVNGRPTGDAMLEFEGAPNAHAAVQNMDGKELLGRTLKVFFA